MAQPATEPPSSFSATLGVAHWHGDYGAPTNTSIVAGLLTLRYRTGGLRLMANLPRMRIRSNGTIFTGIGGSPLFVAPNVAPSRRVRSGYGDITVGANYLLPRPIAGLDVELSGRVKLPTASTASLLSTGKTDYSAGIDLAKSFGRLTPHVAATYRVFGDDGRNRFRNGLDVIAGASYALPDRTTLVVEYEYFERASQLIGDSHEVLLGVSRPFGERVRLSGYASSGLSRGATDISAGASIAFRF